MTHVEPTGKALGAAIKGLDFGNPLGDRDFGAESTVRGGA
jgi:hypothetical protein